MAETETAAPAMPTTPATPATPTTGTPPNPLIRHPDAESVFMAAINARNGNRVATVLEEVMCGRSLALMHHELKKFTAEQLRTLIVDTPLHLLMNRGLTPEGILGLALGTCDVSLVVNTVYKLDASGYCGSSRVMLHAMRNFDFFSELVDRQLFDCTMCLMMPRARRIVLDRSPNPAELANARLLEHLYDVDYLPALLADPALTSVAVDMAVCEYTARAFAMDGFIASPTFVWGIAALVRDPRFSEGTRQHIFNVLAMRRSIDSAVFGILVSQGI